MHFVNNPRLRCRTQRTPGRGAAERADRYHPLFGRRLVLHTRVFEHIGPLATSPGVAVFQVLPKVIGAEEFLCLVALPEFVHVIQVLGSCFPICGIGELLTAVAADIGSGRVGRGGVEGRLHTRERCAGPRMSS